MIPWCKPPSKKSREILLPPSVARHDVRPIKVERRAALLRSIARGRAWLEAVASGVETVEEIAARHKCSVRHVNMTISMAFIAPGLVKAAVEGRLPRGIGIANLRDAPAEWSRQYRATRFNSRSELLASRSTPIREVHPKQLANERFGLLGQLASRAVHQERDFCVTETAALKRAEWSTGTRYDQKPTQESPPTAWPMSASLR